jgi:8-amino-7-oxononanoate synthase
VVLGSNEAVVSAASFLKAKGFLVGAIRHPTVAKSSERLRITLSATHTESQVDSLLAALDGAMRD